MGTQKKDKKQKQTSIIGNGGSITMSVTDRDWQQKTREALSDIGVLSPVSAPARKRTAEIIAPRLDITRDVALARINYLAANDEALSMQLEKS